MLVPKLNMNTYKPDQKAINRSLWGKEEPPSDEERKEQREKLTKELEELRNLGKKKENR